MAKRRYSGLKQKRHLYLTDVAFDYVDDLARASGFSASEVVEQIVRLHIRATAIPSDPRI